MKIQKGTKKGISGVIAFFFLFMFFVSADAAYTDSTYTVKSGDTLYKVSQNTGVSIADLKAINYLTSDMIFVGQILRVKTDNQTHIVASGDTLWLIANRYGITIDSLKSYNNLSSNTIYVGQTLKVKPDTITHTVKLGDTLWKISVYYGTTISEIKILNHLSSDNLWIGQKLLIPDANKSDNTDQNTNSGRPEPVLSWPSITYVVQDGDTASAIAKKFGISQSDILKYNYMDADQWLDSGDTIAINGYAPRQYALLPGEDGKRTLYGHIVDWFLDGQYLIKRNDVFTITDFYTGKYFQVKMLGGYNHIDVEPLTSADTTIMKQLWPTWNWSPRPVVIYKDGMNIAASLSGMPHSYDSISSNQVSGHFDLYLRNSKSHNGASDSYVQQHTNNIQIAGNNK